MDILRRIAIKQQKDFELTTKHSEKLGKKHKILKEQYSVLNERYDRMSKDHDKLKKKEIIFDEAINTKMKMQC